jgi:hypothetical protein
MHILGISTTCKLNISNHLLPGLYRGGVPQWQIAPGTQLMQASFARVRSAIGITCSATSPARPSCSDTRSAPMQRGWTKRRGKNQVRAVRLHATAFVKVRSGHPHKNLIPFSPMTVNTDSM